MHRIRLVLALIFLGSVASSHAATVKFSTHAQSCSSDCNPAESFYRADLNHDGREDLIWIPRHLRWPTVELLCCALHRRRQIQQPNPVQHSARKMRFKHASHVIGHRRFQRRRKSGRGRSRIRRHAVPLSQLPQWQQTSIETTNSIWRSA